MHQARRAPLTPEALARLREAGRIAAAARRLGASRIRAGARLRDVVEAVEAEILAAGAGLAFPAQTSRNAVAAHYCPAPDDESVYEEGDLAKLDLGVHVDGWVVDTALTVNVEDRPAGRALVAAAAAALDPAIAAAGPGRSLASLGATIEAAIRERGFRPVRNLCGHGVDRWTVHCAPPVPNVRDGTRGSLPAGRVVAIEPFATDGTGLVEERGRAEVFMVRGGGELEGPEPGVLASIRDLRGLPFARRQLGQHPREAVEATLTSLLKQRRLVAYPPLVESSGGAVAQAEHSLYIGSDGVEVLTL
jgi:methionyl aminopeptidase